MYNFNMSFANHKLFLVSAIVLLCMPYVARAQLALPEIASPISFIVTPNNPGPEEKVTVRIESYSIDLDRATIDWFVNGRLFDRGNGLKTIDIETGRIGTETTVSVVVRPDAITEIFEQIAIRPMYVSILWEADTYTPPFYQGRALPSSNADILVEAYQYMTYPNGSVIPDDDFVFTWKKNGAILRDISGRGRTKARIAGPLLFGEDIISVEVVSVDNRYKGESRVRIAAVEPHISLYTDDPLLGIMFHRALLETDQIPIADITLAAIPFYMSIKNLLDRNISYEWNVNGQTIPTDPRDPFRIILRLSEGLIANALVSLSISHVDHFLQSTNASWSLLLSSAIGAPQRDPFFRSTN